MLISPAVPFFRDKLAAVIDFQSLRCAALSRFQIVEHASRISTLDWSINQQSRFFADRADTSVCYFLSQQGQKPPIAIIASALRSCQWQTVLNSLSLRRASRHGNPCRISGDSNDGLPRRDLSGLAMTNPRYSKGELKQSSVILF